MPKVSKFTDAERANRAIQSTERYRSKKGPIWKVDERLNRFQRLFGWNYFAGRPLRYPMNEAGREILVLREKLHRWNHEYYVWGESSVSDAVYDESLARLRALEVECPEMQDSNSPTVRVGSPEVSTFPKVPHKLKMLSLEKATTAEQVVKFFPPGAVGIIEPKVDGGSLSLTYHSGKLVQAATRGDGSIGDDVTLNVRTIRNVPLVLDGCYNIEVRGEVYFKWSDFNELNKEIAAANEDLLANPRNAAIGKLKLKDSTSTSQCPLSFMAYTAIGELTGCDTAEAVLEELENLGFSTTACLPTPVKDSESMTQFNIALTDRAVVQDWLTRLDAARKVQDFPTDGLVFKISNLEQQLDLGDGPTGPKWALAFKYPPERVKSKVKGIAVTVKKTGKLTPVADIEPVRVSGTEVASATLCNQAQIIRLNINVGDEVFLQKANEIIPEVLGVATKHSAGYFVLPKKCPSCGEPVKQPEGFVDTFCFNDKCPDQVHARLVHIMGKVCLDFADCGPAMANELMQQGIVKLADLLIVKNPELGAAARKRFLAGQAKAFTQPFWRKLHALCIEDIGKTVSQDMAARWPTIIKLYKDLESDRNPFVAVIGEVKCTNLELWFQQNGDEVGKLMDIGFFNEKLPEAGKTNAKIAGKAFCVTGNLRLPRDKVEDMILAAGGLVKSSVSRKVDYLVVGEGGGVNKARSAARLGTKCLDELEFWTLMGTMPKEKPVAGEDEEF